MVWANMWDTRLVKHLIGPTSDEVEMVAQAAKTARIHAQCRVLNCQKHHHFISVSRLPVAARTVARSSLVLADYSSHGSRRRTWHAWT